VTHALNRTRVDVGDLRRRLGDRLDLHVERTFEDLRVGDVAVPPDVPVALDLTLEAVQGGIDATGHVTTRWAGPCRRCLDPIEGELDVDVRELFVDRAVEGETYPIDHDTIDLVPLIREAVLLSLPLAPLCRDDCPGPDPESFPVTAPSDDEDEPGEPPRDPRWAALDVLRAELEDAEADSRPDDPVG
jgi:uncharacterized protein